MDTSQKCFFWYRRGSSHVVQLVSKNKEVLPGTEYGQAGAVFT